MKYVIVGNGVASVGAIEGIRRVDPDGEILVVSEESSPTYGRPLISYLLAGKIGPERMQLRPVTFYDKNKVKMILGAKVTSIDTKARTVATADGHNYPYDRLLLATGGVPFVPPLPGKDGSGVYSFTTLAHAETLVDVAKNCKQVVVIGGGLIGLKAAEALHDRGVKVSIVELAPRVLSAAFDDKAGNLVSKRLEEVGISVHCSTQATEIKRGPDGEVQGVTLKNGVFLPAQAVVIAIGVVPAAALAKDAGIKVDRGVVVDESLASSDPSVFAAGDVAQAKDLILDENRVVPIWPNAFNQGFYAGKNMAGGQSPYTGGLAMNSISFYGLPTVSVGVVNPAPDETGIEVFDALDEEHGTYRKLVFKDERLVGYVLVGDIDTAGLYTGFIRFKFPLDPAVKEKLVGGQPSILQWPEGFFDEKFNPVGAQEIV
ncbi:Nitrite reductase [NAD(P)H] [Fundidesulfovibrio magnetotacticus]|uniref:Nitrite reductase [NAD(P)H] n=1 Tax=Fundidesulfovibrio magnetotacticus TaxID=2730080 RepID=A0A6V8LRL1_9BACT|nr:FAD-dependent oxidoreductase [Fundidesulfovibrio magnetotacticus]GFK94354.1 Nitrite reductase [NAD(P)H] [Fundidesulfovibrio magnetotacticus]